MTSHLRSVRAAWLIGALALASCTVSVPASSPAPGGTLSTRLTWHACHGSYQCSTLKVPLDWFHTTDKTISLALIRRPASGPNRIGSLLLNPGGPGEPGVSFLTQFMDSGSVPAELKKRFDLMSWDPRGTGASAGIACQTDAQMLEPDPLPVPRTEAERKAVIAKADAINKTCEAKDGAVIPYVGTRQTAHDLDAIRAAVGDPKLSYLGYSYGTAIGLRYLQDFPTHVRAMVLDGVVIPGSDPTTTTFDQVASFEHNLDAFLANCAASPSCKFGNGDPKAALEAFLAALKTGVRIPGTYQLPDDNGVSHTRKGTVGLSEALEGIIAALYNQASWPALEVALANASKSPSPDGSYLLEFRDQLEGRNLDGTWNHSNEANQAISCADQTQRATDLFGDTKLIREWSTKLPFFGAFGAVGEPGCYSWPTAKFPITTPTRADFADTPPVVLVNSIHDPATPYANAKTVLALLPRATLVTWGGEDHTSFAQGHACIDKAVVPYLVDLTAPPPHLECKAP